MCSSNLADVLLQYAPGSHMYVSFTLKGKVNHLKQVQTIRGRGINGRALRREWHSSRTNDNID